MGWLIFGTCVLLVLVAIDAAVCFEPTDLGPIQRGPRPYNWEEEPWGY